MYVPIQKDHESCCPNCGCVLGTVDELPSPIIAESKFPHTVDLAFLGSALEKNVKYSYGRTREQFYEEQVLKQLSDITKEFGIPQSFAFQTFSELKKKNRGFRSKTMPIKQLIKILSKDENYLYIHKMRAIKARYENNSSN